MKLGDTVTYTGCIVQIIGKQGIVKGIDGNIAAVEIEGTTYYLSISNLKESQNGDGAIWLLAFIVLAVWAAVLITIGGKL